MELSSRCEFRGDIVNLGDPALNAVPEHPPPATKLTKASGGHRDGSIPIPRSDLGFRVTKRAFDIIVASLALAALAPFFIAVAIAIRMGDPGPVFFRQWRIGRGGKLFRIYKFRTMAQDKCDSSGISQTVEGDPRVTRIGRFLRRTSLDELPQLINILKGEMSVVGPRPHVPGMLAAGIPYEDFDPRYSARHSVRPGLTGLAQVKGFRGETSAPFPARMRIEYDLEYIRRQSFALDLKIAVLTFWREFFRGSGY